MIQNLTLSNYRGFQNYRLPDLARVNLLVGRNNCGKTSVLQAVALLADRGHPFMIQRIARDRGEYAARAATGDSLGAGRLLTIRHFFHGHDVDPIGRFEIGDGENKTLSVETLDSASIEVIAKSQVRLWPDEHIIPGRPAVWSWYSGADPGEELSSLMPLYENSMIPAEGRITWKRGANAERSSDTQAAAFIPTDSLPRAAIDDFWERVVLQGLEDRVVATLQLLAPEIESVAFLPGDREHASHSTEGILLGLAGSKARVPLGTFGEGVRRLFALALPFAVQQGGVILIDEIDTGLHYTMLEDLWKFVVEAARLNNVQVFATTHSLDCIRGLADLSENKPEFASEVSVQKIEPKIATSVAIGGDKLYLAADQTIEVR